jgi:hypothetical protein
MQKMKKIVIYLLLTCGLAIPYGCKKQLDKLPENAKVEGNAITDQPSANVALNGVYYRLANANNIQTDWSANELMGPRYSGYLADATSVSSLGDDGNLLQSTVYSSEWERYYQLINAANGVIGAVEVLNDNKFVNGRKQQILGEAHFLRAFGHFKLLSYFGQWFDMSSPLGVIIQEKFITLTNKDKSRSSVKECYDSILADVDYAIANAPAASSNVYANRWTASALKMRVLLNRGQGTDYVQAATLGAGIISGSPYILEPNLKDLFYSKGLASSEVMLGIRPQANQESLYINMSSRFIGRSSIYGATKSMLDLYNNDPRKSWMIGGQYEKSNYNYFIKFVQAARTSTILAETAYAFRLTEVYLMLIEATIRSGGNLSTAKSRLKEVMSKSGITDFSQVDAANTADAMLIQTYLEYARNMMAEDGIEWMALLRLPLSTVMQIRPTISSKIQYILPIPRNELTGNPAFGPQNPGYAGL